MDCIWSATYHSHSGVQEEAWSALASLPPSLLLEILPQVLNVEGEALLALLINRLKEALPNRQMTASISKVCCIVDGLFDNRKKRVSSSLYSPVENEFITIASNWNDPHALFNEFSRVQDLLYPLSSFFPAAASRDEAILSMKTCLDVIIRYQPILPCPSLLQNSLLNYTQVVAKAIQSFCSRLSDEVDLYCILSTQSI